MLVPGAPAVGECSWNAEAPGVRLDKDRIKKKI